MNNRSLLLDVAKLLTDEAVAAEVQQEMAFNLFGKWSNSQSVEEREALHVQYKNLDEFYESLTSVVGDSLELGPKPDKS